MNVHLTSYGTGQPLVFFHGWGFDSQIWSSLIPFLKNTYQLFFVDLPGFGKTPLQDWIHFKSDLLSRLPEHFSVAGWSMGGLYATRLAIEESGRVLNLLNITSSPHFINDGTWPGVPKEVFIGFHHTLSHDYDKALRDFIALQTNRGKVQFSPPYKPSKEGLEQGLYLLEAWDLRMGLHELVIPVCFMFGRLDPITPVKTMMAMQKLYPDFDYILFDKAAHMPFLSHTELFIEKLSGFIR